MLGISYQVVLFPLNVNAYHQMILQPIVNFIQNTITFPFKTNSCHYSLVTRLIIGRD